MGDGRPCTADFDGGAKNESSIASCADFTSLLDEDGRIERSVFDVDGSSIRAHVSVARAAECSKETALRAQVNHPGTIPRKL